MNIPGISISMGQTGNLSDSLWLVLLLTVLTLAPAILILCTSFTRIVIVFSFLRQAIGAQNLPPNQVIIGLSLFLTIFVMWPTGNNLYTKALLPYTEKTITGQESFIRAEKILREFMEKEVRAEDLKMLFDVTKTPYAATIQEVPFHFLVPSFILSELKTAFQIGFLLYIPFLILDMVVASVLMAMGMMMLPPVVISLPFKLLLFVLVDGWQLVTGTLLRSFH